MIVIGMAGEDIGFAQYLSPLPRLHVQQKTLAFPKNFFLQNGTVGGGLAEGHKHCAVAVDKLDGKSREGLQIPQNIRDAGLRYKRKNT